MKFLKNILHSIQLMGFRGAREEFYEQLARSYTQKESLRDFFAAELAIAANPKTADSSRAYALRLMRSRLERGAETKYSQILSGIMPDSDKLMLAALDDAPDKPALMLSVANSVRNQKALIGLVKGKLIPPLLILPGAYAFSYVMATKSIPIIVKIAPPEVWNTFNGAVRAFAEYVANHGATTIAVIVAGLFVLVNRMPRWTGPSRAWFESVSPGKATLLFPVAPFILPLVIYRDVQAGMLFTAISVMLRSGRTLNDALSTIRASSQPWMRWQITRILRHLETNPTEYSKAFSKGLLSPKLLARLSSQIRTTPRFDDVLIGLGAKGGEDIRAEVAAQTGKINAMLLAAGGFVVLFMMVGQLAISQTLSDEMSPTKQMARKMNKH